jgi:hypothetical protein
MRGVAARRARQPTSSLGPRPLFRHKSTHCRPVRRTIIVAIDGLCARRRADCLGLTMSGTGFDSIHNYYERLVFDEVLRISSERAKSIDPRLLADIACVALNRLPARYIRHDVDYSFYLTAEERDDQKRRIADAVSQAFSYVTSGIARAATA